MRFLFALLPLLLAWPPLAGAQPAAQGPPPALVVTAEVTEGVVHPPLTLVGTVEPRYDAAVAAEVEGLVEKLEARKGDAVSRGAPLVRLRTVRTELLLQEVRARLEEVEARMAKARADVERAENLFAQKFISEEELEARRTELDALRQQASQIRSAIRLQQDRLQRMIIRAPFSGRVVEEKTEVGQWLGEGDAALILADLSVVHIMVPMPEQQIAGIDLGEKVAVTLDALPGRTFSGQVSAVVPQADTASRTFPVQVSVANKEGRLLAGMLARVTFHPGQPQRAALVPKDALVPQPEGGGHVVKVQDGTAAIVPVRVLAAFEKNFAVEALDSSLAPGDRVVVRGNERLRPGQPVREASSSPAGGERP